MQKPKRRHSWTLELQSDTHEGFVASLRSLLFKAQSRGCFPQGVSGGSGVGYTVSYEENPEQTSERYFEQLDQYLSEIKRAEEAPDAD